MTKLIQSLRVSANSNEKTGVSLDPVRNRVTKFTFLLHESGVNIWRGLTRMKPILGHYVINIETNTIKNCKANEY